MAKPVAVKICGVRTVADISTACDAGARYIGLVFFPKSPRAVDAQQAQSLALTVPTGVAKVALVVDPTDAALDEICAEVSLDMLQLHGDETPQRIAEIKSRYGLPVMKAVGVRSADDLNALPAFEAAADQILLDAKPPKGSDLPGGNGISFDWTLARDYPWRKAWMLAGGLNAETVADAIRISGANQVDVSSGVETAPGIKDASKIAEFLKTVAAL